MKKICYFILLIVYLSGCAAPAKGELMATPTGSHHVSSTIPTFPIAPPPETIVAPTLAPDPTAATDTRLPPEQWQEWPIVPTVTARAIEIYRIGQTMSLDPQAFTPLKMAGPILESPGN